MTQDSATQFFTTRAGFSPREEWGYRYRNGGGTFGPVHEQEARFVVSQRPNVFELVRRVVEVPEWTTDMP